LLCSKKVVFLLGSFGVAYLCGALDVLDMSSYEAGLLLIVGGHCNEFLVFVEWI